MSKQLPSVFTTQTFDDAFRAIPTADLLAELESDRWLALELADHGPSRQYCEHMIDRTIQELERRQRLLARRPDDPLAPRWPDRDTDLRDRIQAVKDAWPIERFVREVLLCEARPVGNKLLAHCPLPGHDDSTPSFNVFADGHAHCFGCGRGGDVIALTGYFFGFQRFYESLEMLESMSGIGRAA